MSSIFTVSITDRGPDPANITIQVGDTVVWNNITTQPQAIRLSPRFFVFVPMVLRDAGNNSNRSLEAGEPTQYTSQTTSGDLFNLSLRPGESYSYTFASPGAFAFLASTGLGQVAVLPIQGPVSTATPTPTTPAISTQTPTPTSTSEAIGTPTATGTSAPASTSTSTPTPTSTSTSTPTPTPTPTGTATNTPTPTPTSTSTATSTPTPTSTDAATNTPTPTSTGTATNTPTPTPTSTGTATNTPTPTSTGTATSTPTPTPTSTSTNAPTPTPTTPAKPDLVISGIQTGSLPLVVGQPFTLSVVISNAGNDASGAFSADWYTDLLTVPATSQAGAGNWQVITLAAGSAVTLSTTQVFTTTGTHTLWARVDRLGDVDESNENNNAAGPVTVTVASNVINVCSNISSNTTWLSGWIYWVTCSLTVNNGVTLTLEPGVIVKMNAGTSLNVQGTLISQGTAQQPVIITSIKDDAGGDTNADGNASSPAPGDWSQIYIADGRSAIFNFTIVRYGGGTTTPNPNYAMLRGYGSAAITLRNSQILFSDNTAVKMNINGSDSSTAYPYTATLIVANSIISGSRYYGLWLPAFTNTAFGKGRNILTVTNSTIANNGSDGINLVGLIGSITSTSFISNNGYGLAVNIPGIPFNNVRGNSYTNNRYNAIALVNDSSSNYNNVFVGTISLPNEGVPYVFYSAYIQPGATLILEPGVIVKLPASTGITFANGANATLLSQGTAQQPVYITSIKDDSVGGDTNADGNTSTPAPGDWSQIYVYDGSSAIFDFTIIRYGGGTTTPNPNYAMLRGVGSAAITLRNSQVLFSDNTAVKMNINGSDSSTAYPYTATLIVANSIISGSRYYGLWLPAFTNTAWGNGRNVLTVTNSTIANNGSDGINLVGLIGSITSTSFISNNGYGLAVNIPGIPFNNVRGNTYINNRFNAIALVNNPTSNANNLFIGITSLPNEGVPYVFYSAYIRYGATLILEPGVIVKLPASTGITFDNGANATLLSQGTAQQPVYITSIKDDSVGGDTNADGNASSPAPGDWSQIYVYDGNSAIFDFTIIRYGGGTTTPNPNYAMLRGVGSAAITLRNSQVLFSDNTAVKMNMSSSDCSVACPYTSTVIVNNSLISNNRHYGLWMPAFTNTAWGKGRNVFIVTNSTIANNGSDGINVSGASNSSIRASLLFGNGGLGLNNSSGTSQFAVDARYNWWGSDSGPAPFGTGNGINGRSVCDPTCHTVYDVVLVTPWGGAPAVTQYNSAKSSGWSAFVADPVNVVFGNYTYEYTDLSIPDRGLGFTFKRFYNSNIKDDGPLGVGWSHSYNITASVIGTNTVLIRRADGRLDQFVGSGSSFVPPPGTFDQLAQIGSTWVLTQPDQTVLTFDASGRLVTIADKNGNTSTLGYTLGNLTSFTMPDGRVITFVYAGNKLTGLIDPAGRSVTFSYAGNLLQSVTDLTGKTTQYGYAAQSRLATITDANGHTFVNNTYDALGRVIEQRDALNNLTTFDYYTPTQQTIITDALGAPITYTYDAAYRVISEQDALGLVTQTEFDAFNNRVRVIDKRGNVTGYGYDAGGNVISVTDALNQSTSFTYDARNNLLSQTDPLSRIIRFGYDVRSNRVAITDALGVTTTMSYFTDSLRSGLLASLRDGRGFITRYNYDQFGNRTVLTDALSNVTTWSFDNVGRMLSMTDARGGITRYGYDAGNHTIAITNALYAVTRYGYDAVGNKVVMTDALGQMTRYGYSAKDQLSSVIDALGYVTSYSYDTVGNKIAVTDGNGHTTQYGFDPLRRPISETNALDQTSRTFYDPAGNRIAIQDALGKSTTLTYDALNRVIAVSDPLGNTSQTGYDAVGNKVVLTDANGIVTRYGFDALNRLAVVTDALSGVVRYGYDQIGNKTIMTDALGHVTTYVYDALNRLNRTVDPLGHIARQSYDAVGNRNVLTDANGAVTNYTFDSINRLLQSSAPGLTINYAYDALGNRIAMTDTSGTTRSVYDALNRPLTITQPTGSISYAYDALNRTKVIYPDGSVVTSIYDAANQLQTVKDWANRTTTYTYDAAGRQIAVAYPNGAQMLQAFDLADHVIAITHTSPVSGPFAFFRYQLDPAGNRLSMTDPDGITSYTYDALYRLTQVNYPVGLPSTVRYSYDAMGNRLVMTDTAVTTYSYDAADRLLAAGTLTLTWDNNGNMLSKGGATFSWDAANRLIGIISATQSVSYTYNGDGVRLAKWVNGTPTRYAQDVVFGLPMVLTESTGASNSRYLYGNDLIAQDNGNINYYHADALGSTRRMSNAAGQATANYTYDAFGATRSQAGGIGNSVTFAGEQSDLESGLMFLRARYYDAQVGRFISADRYFALQRAPQSFNRFVYVQNNPHNLRDRTGNAWYDTFDANKNGINASVLSLLGSTDIDDKLVHKTPVLGGLVETAEMAEGYSSRGRALELITEHMTEEDQANFDRLESQGIKSLLSAEKRGIDTVMDAPCTTFNPTCGLQDFIPDVLPLPLKAAKELRGAYRNPLSWTLGKLVSALVDPWRRVPGLSVARQISQLNTPTAVQNDSHLSQEPPGAGK